jgi:hypothetical protein
MVAEIAAIFSGIAARRRAAVLTGMLTGRRDND